MQTNRSPLPLFAVLLAVACASAGDRLEEGIEAQAYGRYHEAALRFVDALEKDETMTEARDRLLVVGDSVVRQGMRSAAERSTAGDGVGAGEEFMALDRLLTAARRVGVRLPTPEAFPAVRRAAFDAAADELMAVAREARSRQQWASGRRALVRLREDFQPDAARRDASLDEERGLLLDWARAEERSGRYRSAWDLADEILSLGGPVAGELADEVVALQERAVELGTRRIAVFPVEKASDLGEIGEEDPAILLSDVLELDHWRRPPVFLAVADPVIVRQLTRRYSPPGVPLRPDRVLGAVGADYGVLIQITTLTRTEDNVRQRVRTARTAQGGYARYTEEEGTQRYLMEVEVVVLEAGGGRQDSFRESQRVSGSFHRARYEGDVRDLELNRRERMLFDPVPQAQARAELEGRLADEVAASVAEHLFRRLLRTIP